MQPSKSLTKLNFLMKKNVEKLDNDSTTLRKVLNLSKLASLNITEKQAIENKQDIYFLLNSINNTEFKKNFQLKEEKSEVFNVVNSKFFNLEQSLMNEKKGGIKCIANLKKVEVDLWKFSEVCESGFYVVKKAMFK
ncbi:hypothetical protein HDU92_008222 [Lobulomyces angularis]|nr:hypothetical protein HDU92_008222 [Lobulomyces angularis]